MKGILSDKFSQEGVFSCFGNVIDSDFISLRFLHGYKLSHYLLRLDDPTINIYINLKAKDKRHNHTPAN